MHPIYSGEECEECGVETTHVTLPIDFADGWYNVTYCKSCARVRDKVRFTDVQLVLLNEYGPAVMTSQAWPL